MKRKRSWLDALNRWTERTMSKHEGQAEPALSRATAGGPRSRPCLPGNVVVLGQCPVPRQPVLCVPGPGWILALGPAAASLSLRITAQQRVAEGEALSGSEQESSVR